MNPDEKIQKIKELEKQFLFKVDEIQKDYTAKIKAIIASVEREKISALKKDLGM